MSEVNDPSAVLRRRHLLGRGAAVAGAAAGAVALGAVSALPAAASDGDALKQGSTFTGTKKTGLVVDSTTVPPLELSNPSGPALRLTPVGKDFTGDLAPGDLLSIGDRPLFGASFAGERYTTGIATTDDLVGLSLPYAANPPSRLLDTRSASSRAANVARTGGPGFDSAGRLSAGAYADVKVGRADGESYLDAAFLNLTSTGSTAGGYLVAYPPGDRPASSSLNFAKGATIANGTLVALGVVGDFFVVRIYANVATHVILDLTGTLEGAIPGPAADAAVVRRSRSAARRPSSALAKAGRRTARR